MHRLQSVARVSEHVDGRPLIKAEAFQSIMFLASPEDVYSRFHVRCLFIARRHCEDCRIANSIHTIKVAGGNLHRTRPTGM